MSTLHILVIEPTLNVFADNYNDHAEIGIEYGRKQNYRIHVSVVDGKIQLKIQEPYYGDPDVFVSVDASTVVIEPAASDRAGSEG